MHFTRRDFVGQALALAAAAAARSGSANDAAAQPTATRTVGPNDKLRVAVIGLSGRGGAHVGEWLANPDAEVVALSDCDPAGFEKRRSQLKDLPRPPRFEQDFRRLLDDKSIDIISIATPNHWHAVMSVWAMQAGKDVYVEKPCSHNVEEGRVITQWARKLGRICQMGAQSRSMTGMRQAIDFVRSGKIGDVKVAHAICYKRRKSIGLVDIPAPLPAGIDFDLWAGPAPKVAVLTAGPLAEHQARSGWVADLMRVRGAEVHLVDAGAAPDDAALTAAVVAVANIGVQTTVVAVADARHADLVPRLAPRLVAEARCEVVLAGRAEVDPDPFAACGVTRRVWAGLDLVAWLRDALPLEVMAPPAEETAP